MKHVYTSIDLGTDSIKVVVCELFNNKLNLLAASSAQSKGIKKGLITDVYEASASLEKAVNEVEQMLGIKIQKVLATIPSCFAEFSMSSGAIQIDVEEAITGKEISDLLKLIVEEKQSDTHEIVSILPIDFTVDEQVGIKDPKGLFGNVLGIRAITVTTPKKNIYSVVSLLENAGLEVVDITIGSIADISALKEKEMESQVGALINIGYDTTTVSLYNKGIMVKNSVLGKGSRYVDYDIMYRYKVDEKDAIRLKEHFALAHKNYASVNDVCEIEDKLGMPVKVNQFELSETVMSRIEEILLSAKKEINSLTKRTVDYILVTGGISTMDNFSMVAEEILGKKAKVGYVRLVGIRNNKYSTALGNIIYFIQKTKLKGQDYTMIRKTDMEQLSSPGKGAINVSSDSMLGRVFGYFFND